MTEKMHLNFFIPKSIVEELDKIGDRVGVSRSELMRRAIKETYGIVEPTEPNPLDKVIETRRKERKAKR